MLNAVNSSTDEEKQFEEDYIRQHVGSLYGIHMDGEPHLETPHWTPEDNVFGMLDELNWCTVAKEALGLWDVTDNVVQLDASYCETDVWYKVWTDRIADEVELQDENGNLWYTGFPIIVSVYVNIPENIAGRDQHEEREEFQEAIKQSIDSLRYTDVEKDLETIEKYLN